MKILLTHPLQARAQYYGERSLNGLRALAEVKLHEADHALDAAGLVEAAGDVDIIDADRLTEGRGEIFAKLPNVIATPHIGGLTPPAIESQSLETVRQVEAIIHGEAPIGAVNAGHWTRRP